MSASATQGCHNQCQSFSKLITQEWAVKGEVLNKCGITSHTTRNCFQKGNIGAMASDTQRSASHRQNEAAEDVRDRQNEHCEVEQSQQRHCQAHGHADCQDSVLRPHSTSQSSSKLVGNLGSQPEFPTSFRNNFFGGLAT